MKKPKPTPPLLDRIMASNCSDSAKVIKLWAVTMIHYRTPLGDQAWYKIRELIGEDGASALAFLTGYCFGYGSDMKANPDGHQDRTRKLMELVPEMEGK